MGDPVVHFEIGCRDAGETASYYRELFGWDTEEAGPATMISTGSDAGIAGHITALGHEPHEYVTVYVDVSNLEEKLAEVVRLGGTTVIPPNPVPGRGRFAWFADPAGNTIGLWETGRGT